MPQNVQIQNNSGKCLINNGIFVLLAGMAITGGGVYSYSTGNEFIGSAIVMLGLFASTFGCLGTKEKVCQLVESHSERIPNEIEMGHVGRITSGRDAQQPSLV